MSERQWSLADRFVYVANEVRKIDDGVDNDNPHRYPLRKMKIAAEKAIFDALTTAADIAACAHVLKDEIKKMDARNLP